jgi:ethanolamine permease
MASENVKVSGVTYKQVTDGYFEKRQLRRAAGVWGLWGLAVAAVISGDFSGWNFGLDVGGFGGLLIAFGILVVMYYGLIFSIGEMAAAMPHTGGAYSFARSAMGPWGGFITGLAETIEYVATTAVIVFFSASYAEGILNDLTGQSLPTWAWWLILYAAFIALNGAGALISFRFAIVVSIISIGIILVFSAMALFSGLFSWDNLFNIAPAEGGNWFLPYGPLGILYAIPFAVWFFLGIEELPLAAEESHTPEKDIPRAGVWARGTLIVTGLLVLFLNTGVLGAEEVRVSGEPLLDGFRAILQNDQLAAILGMVALIGLLASLQGIMFAYGRNMYSLSRAGYYPKWLSVTNKQKVPLVALVAGAVIGYVALLLIEFLTAIDAEGAGAVAGAVVLNIAVWGAMLAYGMQAAAFLILRKKLPNINRPYKSPWGVFGGWAALIIAGISFVGYLINPAFLPAIIGIAAVYVVMLIGFAVWGRHNLVLSPEEQYAIKARQ